MLRKQLSYDQYLSHFVIAIDEKRKTEWGKMAATSIRAHSHTPLQTINRGNHFMRPLRSPVAGGKQKSAVELLQESKCLYVKSETVLDHQQRLQVTTQDSFHCSSVKVRGPPVPPKSAQLRRSYNSSASSTDQLQAKLRKLLNADSKENLIEDSNIGEEVNKCPQHYRRSNSQKQSQDKKAVCVSHHKSLPDLHGAPDTSSDSSEPASCEYVLYTNDRKCSSTWQSTIDETCVHSSASKPLSSHESSRSSSRGSRQALALASPVKSSLSYGGSTSQTTSRHTDATWNVSGDGDLDDVSRLRPILRSKSDVGRRYMKLTPAPLPPPTPADLDTFFDQLGLSSLDFNSMSKVSSQTSSPVFFSDTSSVDSSSLCAASQCAGGSEETTGSTVELPSIIERNARIIKWLCNCRKAQLSIPTGIS